MPASPRYFRSFELSAARGPPSFMGAFMGGPLSALARCARAEGFRSYIWYFSRTLCPQKPFHHQDQITRVVTEGKAGLSFG
jgi:hypothetical protein